MRHTRFSRLEKAAAWSLAVALLFVLVSCSDDEEDFIRHTPWVLVQEMTSGQGGAGVKVAVMDPATNLPVAGPVVSDAEGRCAFPGLKDGLYQLVVFGGADYRVLGLESPSWRVNLGGVGKTPAPLVAPSKTPPAPGPALVLVAAWIPQPGLPRIAGSVVDAATGDPLEQAFVSTSPFLSGYLGGTTFQDDMTTEDGQFSVSEIPFAQDPVSGNLVQVQPLLIHCAGYQPRAWVHEAPNGDYNTDISGVSIALTAIDEHTTGHLAGRLIMNGSPARNVVIGAGSVGLDKSAVGMPGAVAMSDDDGLFHISNLPEGSYFLQAGFLPGDGFLYPDQPGNVAHPVATGETTEVGDLLVLNEINLYSPALGGSYYNASVIFPMTWSEVSQATRYQVFVDGNFLGESTTNSLDGVDDFTLTPGLHIWGVTAFNAEDEILGAVEAPVTFRITGTEH